MQQYMEGINVSAGAKKKACNITGRGRAPRSHLPEREPPALYPPRRQEGAMRGGGAGGEGRRAISLPLRRTPGRRVGRRFVGRRTSLVCSIPEKQQAAPPAQSTGPIAHRRQLAAASSSPPAQKPQLIAVRVTAPAIGTRALASSMCCRNGRGQPRDETQCSHVECRVASNVAMTSNASSIRARIPQVRVPVLHTNAVQVAPRKSLIAKCIGWCQHQAT